MIRSEMAESTVSAISTTMAGHTSDLDPARTQNVVSTTSDVDVHQESGTNCTKEMPFQASLQDELNPAIALEFDLDLDHLVDHPKFDDDPDHIDWDSYFPFAVNDNAAKASQELNDFDDENPEEESFEPVFGAPAVQPESHSLPGFPFNFDDDAAAEQNLDEMLAGSATSATQSEDRSSHISSPGNVELPDSPPGLDFLQSLQLIGREIQPAMIPDVGYNTQQLPHSTGNSAIQDYRARRLTWDGASSASRVALTGSSEPDPENESRAVLTNPRRPLKGYQEGATQEQSDRSPVQRNKKYNENSLYTPLNQAPETWSIFEYTKDGELDPSRLYSAEEINRFLFTHVLHQGQRNLKESPLRLRVHKTPASSAKRFPSGLKCRFQGCPMRTINQGQLLIVVDELSVQYPDHDPFLNAAYYHLYCIERYCNFAEICAKLNVSAKGRDTRKEKGRRNRFVFTLDEEIRVIEDFVSQCCANARRGVGGNPWVARCPDQQTSGCSHYDPQSLPYKGTLGHQLAVTKLHYGGRGRINLRKNREDRAGYEGANLTRHLFDLSKEAELREFSRRHRNQNQLKPNPKTGRSYRADFVDVIEEDEQPDCSQSEPSLPQTHQPSAVSSPHQAHGTKRNRDELDHGQSLGQDIVQAHKKSRRQGPELKIPEWNLDRSRRVGFGIEGFEGTVDGKYHNQDICMADTPGTSPRTTLAPRSRRTHSQLQTTTTSPPQDGRSASINGQPSMTSEDESEGEIDLKVLAAQRRTRSLEIEDAKDKEKKCRFKKLKLQKANKEKRARDEGDDDKDWTDRREKWLKA